MKMRFYNCKVFVLLYVRKALIGSVESFSIALNPAVQAHSNGTKLIKLLRILMPIKCGLAIDMAHLFLRHRKYVLLFYFLIYDACFLVVKRLINLAKTLLFLFNFL